MDHRNDWKQKLYDQYIRIDKTKGILTIGLLITNLSLTLWGLLGWDYNAFVAVPTIMTILGVTGIIFANIWVDGFGFYKNEIRANVSLDPKQVYQQNPFQEMVWREVQIPKFRALATLLENQGSWKRASEIRQQADKLEEWCDLGYIPKDAFPEHLKHHYLAEEGERL